MKKPKKPYHGLTFKKEAVAYCKQHGIDLPIYSLKNRVLYEAIEAHKAGDAAKINLLKNMRHAQLAVAKAFKPRLDSISFYDSYEWKQVRYQALLKHGAACQCCGATRADGVKLHVDHIKPRSKYPELELSLDNLQILCEPCNMGKRAWDETDWREHPPGRGMVLWAD